MNDDAGSTRVAEYVLGTLDRDERHALEEQRARDPSIGEEIAWWEAALAPLTEGISASVTPSESVWANIEAGLDSTRSQVPATTVRTTEGDWIPVLRGVAMKLLYTDPQSGVDSFLLRLDAGAALPPHPHQTTEECVVVSGEVSIGRITLSAGDYHVARPEMPHPVVSSATGATLFLRGSAPRMPR